MSFWNVQTGAGRGVVYSFGRTPAHFSFSSSNHRSAHKFRNVYVQNEEIRGLS
jgi:hypothetical protein